MFASSSFSASLRSDLENPSPPLPLPDGARRHSRDEDSMGLIVIWAEVARERYKIRSISLSVLNTTETNLDTSLFGVICSSSLPPSSYSPRVPFGIVRPFSQSSRGAPQQIKHLHSRPEDGTSKPTLRR